MSLIDEVTLNFQHRQQQLDSHVALDPSSAFILTVLDDAVNGLLLVDLV